jgi:predicted small lipoprotein YifL
MNKYPIKILLAALLFSLLACACGNKGPLVKPDEQTIQVEAEAKQ